MKTVSGLFSWAIKNDLATVNPAEKLEKLGGRTEGFYTWTEEDVEAFENHWPVGTRQRLAMAIMLYLGVRRSDAVVIGRKHESQDGQMVTFQMFKGRKKGVRVLSLPILPPLRAILDASELGHEAWLESNLGKPYGNAGFGNVFKDWCKEAGLPQCHCHGLRKIGAVRAAEAGRERARAYGDVRLGRCGHGARLHTQGGAEKTGRKRCREGRAPRSHCPTDCPTGRNSQQKQQLRSWMVDTTGIEPVTPTMST